MFFSPAIYAIIFYLTKPLKILNITFHLVQKMPKASQYVPYDASKVSSTSNLH